MNDVTDVMITLSGTDGEDKIGLTTRGTLAVEEHGFSLKYQEIDPDGEGFTRVSVQCDREGIDMRREGDTINRLRFRMGETFMGEYDTPMGPMQLKIFPSTVKHQRRGHLGKLDIAYQIDMSMPHAPTGTTSMRWLTLSFRPCKQ